MRKVIVLLFVTAFLMLVINAYSQGPSPTPGEKSQEWQDCTTKTNKKGNSHQECRQKNPLLIKVVESEASKAGGDKQRENKDQKSFEEHLIKSIEIGSPLISAIAAAVIAIFTVFLVGYNKKMLEITDQSMTIAKAAADATMKNAESLQAIERAYLVVDSIEWINKNIPSTLSEFNESTIKIKLANIGKTSSFIKVINCKIIFKEDGYPSKNELNFTMPLDPPEYIINGGGVKLLTINKL